MTSHTDKPMWHDHGGGFSPLLSTLPSREQADQAASVFSHLCDGTRLCILYLLCHCESCVTDIAAAVDMSTPAVSHHLRLLRDAGLITGRRVGKEVLYTLADTEEARSVHGMVDRVFRMKCPKEKE